MLEREKESERERVRRGWLCLATLCKISHSIMAVSVSSTASRAHKHISEDANIILRKPISFDMMHDVIFVSINESSIDKSESQFQIIHQQINRYQHHIRFFFMVVGGRIDDDVVSRCSLLLTQSEIWNLIEIILLLFIQFSNKIPQHLFIHLYTYKLSDMQLLKCH